MLCYCLIRFKPIKIKVTETVVYETGKTMLIGYARVSKSDGSQVLDPQIDALIEHGVTPDHIYSDYASGKNDERPGLLACLRALRAGDFFDRLETRPTGPESKASGDYRS